MLPSMHLVLLVPRCVSSSISSISIFFLNYLLICFLCPKKRIMELEEIIRRKNMVISKMKKDMLALEQQVLCKALISSCPHDLYVSCSKKHTHTEFNI